MRPAKRTTKSSGPARALVVPGLARARRRAVALEVHRRSGRPWRDRVQPRPFPQSQRVLRDRDGESTRPSTVRSQCGQRLGRRQTEVIDDAGPPGGCHRDREGEIPVPVDVNHFGLQSAGLPDRGQTSSEDRMGRARRGRVAGIRVIVAVMPFHAFSKAPPWTKTRSNGARGGRGSGAVGQLRPLETTCGVEVVRGDQDAHA